MTWWFGVFGLLGLAGFFIGYALSNKMVIARRDYWALSEYQVFKKRLGYANYIGIGAAFVSFVIFTQIADAIS